MLRLSICTFFISVALLATGCSAGLPASGIAMVAIVDEGVTSSTGNELGREGRACTINVLGLVTVGDGSIKEAMQDGNITTVASIDREIYAINIWWVVFSRSCTVVQGQ